MKKFLFIIIVVFAIGILHYKLSFANNDTLPRIIITEIHANPTSSPEYYHEWIEIFNQSTNNFEGDISISDEVLDNKDLLHINIPPNSYHIIAARDAIIPGISTDSISRIIDGKIGSNGLRNSGESISLFDENNTLMEVVTYSNANINGDSLHRENVLNTIFTTQDMPTPLSWEYEQNSSLQTPLCETSDNIYISEIFPNPLESPEDDFEWIEITNVSTRTISLKGWTIGDGETIDAFDDETTLPIGISLVSKNEVNAQGNQILLNSNIGNGLSNSGDEVMLTDCNGKIIDFASYENSTEGESYQIFESNYFWGIPTPGELYESNPHNEQNEENEANEIPGDSDNSENLEDMENAKFFTINPTFKITSMYPNPSKGDDEWIEITNTGKSTASLSQWILDDELYSGSKQTILPDREITSGQSIKLYSKSGETPTGIKLNNDGDCANLTSPKGILTSSLCYESSTKAVIIKNTDQSIETPSPSNTLQEFSISQIKSMDNDICGIISVTSHTPSGNPLADRLYAHDETGAIGILLLSVDQIQSGTQMKVTGCTDIKYGEKIFRADTIEIQNISPTSSPKVEYLNSFRNFTHTIGSYITITTEVSRSSGNTFWIWVNGKELQVKITEYSKATKPKIRKGDWIQVKGILSIYKTSATNGDGIRLLPVYENDILKTLVPTGIKPPLWMLLIFPNMFLGQFLLSYRRLKKHWRSQNHFHKHSMAEKSSSS